VPILHINVTISDVGWLAFDGPGSPAYLLRGPMALLTLHGALVSLLYSITRKLRYNFRFFGFGSERKGGLPEGRVSEIPSYYCFQIVEQEVSDTVARRRRPAGGVFACEKKMGLF
jgi:hypothetical protein